MNICESNHSRSRDARALHGHNQKYSSQIPRESAGFKVAQSENFGLEYGSDRLKDEAFRRAHDGGERPLVSAGKIVKDDEGVSLRIREYSDTLMCLLLKSRRPEKYRDRVTNEHVGP